MRHLQELEAVLNAEFCKRTSADWLERLEHAAIPAGPVLDVLEMHANEQTRAREMIVELNHPVRGRFLTVGNPIKLSASPTRITPSPLLGAVHDFALVHLGIHLIDNCDLEALSEAAAARKRWDFLLTMAPIPVVGGTGSPINPIATF